MLINLINETLWSCGWPVIATMEQSLTIVENNKIIMIRI